MDRFTRRPPTAIGEHNRVSTRYFARRDDAEWTSKPLSDVRDGWHDTVECATALVQCYEDGMWIRVRDDCERHAPSRLRGVCSNESTAEK
ncbi:uncharacterized protein BN903_83 [Halorubrum sp. AJ67]|nr:uncharacterized protein BN903_83 [Halorubrum sp. AJ67]